MKKIVCGKDNVAEFNQRLKAQVPEFLPVIKALYKVGMIDGLRGATIEPLDKKPTTPPQKAKTVNYCGQCHHWQKDRIGDGLGAGKCKININPRISKRPRTESCSDYKESNE